MPRTNFERKTLERAARLYKTDMDAARALGCKGTSFRRACGRYGIVTPNQRKAMAEAFRRRQDPLKAIKTSA